MHVVAVHCLLCFRKIWKEEFISCRTISLMDGNSLALLLFFFFVACYFLEVILILIEQWMIQKKSIRLASCENWIMETFLMLQEMIKIPDILHSLLFTFCSLFFSMGFFIKLCFCLFDLFSAWKREREREGGLITHKP